MKIHLPNSAFLGNIDPFFRNFDPHNLTELYVTSNKNWVSVHPLVLTMIAALGCSVSPKKVQFEIIEAKSKHYFERMGLFKILRLDSGIVVTEHDPSGRFVPLTQIKTSSELSNFISEMIPLLHLSPEHSEPICYIVSELVRNVLEHANTQLGAFVAAQYYQKSNTIRIGICDTGVGIRKTMSKFHTVSNDAQALELALTPGITGTTAKEGGTEQNAGAGLFFVKSIAATNGDFFGIYSGNTFYKLLKQKKVEEMLHSNPFEDRHSIRSNYPHWQGVAIGIDIKLDTHQKFTSLLQNIRSVYAQAIRDRKRLHFKKPKFT